MKQLVHHQYLMIIMMMTTLVYLSMKERAEAAISMAKPGCPETCGNVSIIYPFGIGKDCYLHKDFEITCSNNNNSSGGRPVMRLDEDNEAEILHLSWETIRIMDWTSLLCYPNFTSRGMSYARMFYLPMESFSYSQTDNKFMAVGCDIYAYIGNYNDKNSSNNYTCGCVSICNGGRAWSPPDSCSGIGCCQTTFREDLTTYEILAGNMSTLPFIGGSNGCTLVLIIEKKFGDLSKLDPSFSPSANINKKYFYPAVLNWGIGTFKSCLEAQESGDYACGRNSHCVSSKKGTGYLCRCISGYTGNPYLPHGCQDINECMEQNNQQLCKNGAVCSNTNGSYNCKCPDGYRSSNDDKNEFRCIPNKENLKAAILISSGIGIILVILVLLVIGFWLHREFEVRKKNRLKQKFFRKNGGLLLQQQISSTSQGNVEKTRLYTIEELEKATDNFNAGRVLGMGGYGQVYKGMLLDGSIVAIKKSIIVDQRQVAGFVNEVFILSQINHRHIVRLLGCCLESEVPLLVYEFVSNRTLYHHLHNREEDDSTLSWENRLRIAEEIAGALAYLHSYASPAILHRDIKSSNILLDENFRVVVSDFGLSRPIANDKTHLTTLVQGTFGYLDPEYFRSGQFTDKCDVYAFGVVLAEILTGEKVISSSRPEESLAIHFRLAMKRDCLLEILDKVIVNEGQKEVITTVSKLAKSCMKLSGKKRPSMREIAAELERLRNSEQASVRENFQGKCSLSARSYSYASTSAVTEEYLLDQGQEFSR